MILFFKYRWNRVAIKTTAISFAISTLLMLVSLIVKNTIINILTILYLGIYIPMTIILLGILFINTIATIKDINEHSIAFAIVLINLLFILLYNYFLI